MSSITGLAGNTIWYGLSSIVARFFSYLLVPLYTTIFLPGEYGIVTELYGYTAFLYPLFTYGMETAYFRFSTKHKSVEPSNFDTVVSVLISSSFVFSGLLVWFGQDLALLLDYEGKQIVLYWLAAVLAVDAITAIPFARLRLQNKPKKFAFIRLFNVLFAVFLNLFFLVFCLKIYNGEWLPSLQPFMLAHFDSNFKVKYIFLSNLISNSLLMLFLHKEFKGFRFQLHFEKLRPILIYGIPLLFMSLASVTNEMLSRILLKYWLPDGYYPLHTSIAALGIFGACYKLSVFMQLGIQAFRYAAEPFYFAKADDKKSLTLFAHVLTGFVIFNTVVFIGISANLEWIGIIFLGNPVYREGLFIVPILLLAYLFNGIYYNLSIWYKVKDKTMYGAVITGAGAFVTIFLNYFLIPSYGYLGSVIVTLVVFIAMATVSFCLGRKYYPIPYQVGRVMGYIVYATVLVFICYHLSTGQLWANILVKNMSVVVFVASVYSIERKHLKGRVVFGLKLP